MEYGDKAGQELLRLENVYVSLITTYKIANHLDDTNFQKVLKVYQKEVNNFCNEYMLKEDVVIINPTIEEKEEALIDSVPATQELSPLAQRMAELKAKKEAEGKLGKVEETKW